MPARFYLEVKPISVYIPRALRAMAPYLMTRKANGLDELARGGIRRTSLGFQLDYDFALRGPNRLDDPQGILGLSAEPTIWQVAFWMGGWDADALCGYTLGRLTVADA